jgi:STE24 endopeptidase
MDSAPAPNAVKEIAMWILVALLLIQFAISTALSALNLHHLRRKAADPPSDWVDRLDTDQFPRVIAYTAAKMRLGLVARAAGLVVTLAILLSGFLPALIAWAAALPVARIWQGLLVMAVPSALSYLTDLPWDLLSQFGVERRFGFSTITVRTWLLDQLKSLLLAGILGLILGGGLLLLIRWLPHRWWLPAWAFFAGFQLLFSFIAPVLILPLFNKFEPLHDDELREQILDLAHQADFPVGGVYQVDASLRTTHSNAYFTGLGKTRRIALFDSLLEQLSHNEILAVMAHEIGHWKLGHMWKQQGASILASGLAMLLVAQFLDMPWLYQAVNASSLYDALGLSAPVAALGLYVVGILLSPIGLILAPIANWTLRRFEYQADRYALDLYPHPTALKDGLIKLSEKNLSNLFPHPLVVVFRYSHPPLMQRVSAIQETAPQEQ